MSDYWKVDDWVAPELQQDLAYKALWFVSHVWSCGELLFSHITPILVPKVTGRTFPSEICPSTCLDLFLCAIWWEDCAPNCYCFSLHYPHFSPSKLWKNGVKPCKSLISAQTMPGGLKLRTPSPNPSSYSLFNIEKPLVLGPRKSEKKYPCQTAMAQ